MLFYILLRAVDRFYEEYSRYPGIENVEADIHNLRVRFSLNQGPLIGVHNLLLALDQWLVDGHWWDGNTTAGLSRFTGLCAEAENFYLKILI